MKKIYNIVILLTITSGLFAIFNDYGISPRRRALGGISASSGAEAFDVFHNPASLHFGNDQVQFSYTKPFGNDFEELTAGAMTYSTKKWGTFGLGFESMDVDYLGVNLQSEKVINFSHSLLLLKDVHSEIAFGYSINAYSLSFDEMGDDTDFGMNVGFRAVLHTRTHIGVYLTNLNDPSLGKENKHELPKYLMGGITYVPYNGVKTSFEIKKGVERSQMLNKTEFHAGVEVTAYDILFLRVGVQNEPNKFSAGFGINYKNILLDYGFDTHIIGDTHQISIGYQF